MKAVVQILRRKKISVKKKKTRINISGCIKLEIYLLVGYGKLCAIKRIHTQ